MDSIKGMSALSVFGYIPYTVIQGARGPQGLSGTASNTGATGPFAGFLQSDRQGRASVQTRPDSGNYYAGPAIPYNLYTQLVLGLDAPFYVSDPDQPYAPPYTTPITQASIVSALQTYGGGADELSALEADGFDPTLATLEIESMNGLLVGALRGLGLTVPTAVGALVSTGSISFQDPSGAMRLNSTSLQGFYGDGDIPTLLVRCNNGDLDTIIATISTELQSASYLKPRELSVVGTGTQGPTAFKVDFLGGDGTQARAQLIAPGEQPTITLLSNGEYGAGQISIGNGSKTAIVLDGNEGLRVNDAGETPILHAHTALAQVSVENACFSVQRYVQPADTYTIAPADVAKAMIIGINDVSSPVSVVLPIGVPSGMLVVVKSETTSTANDITISVDGGGLIDDVATYTMNLSYQSKGFYYASGSHWFAF